MLSYYTGFVQDGSADDRTILWTTALTEYVFSTDAIFVLNAKDGSFASYYTGNPRVDHMGASLLICLEVKFFGALKYLGLYKIAQYIRMDLFLTAMALHRCCKRDCKKTAVRDGPVSYNLFTCKVYGLEKETVSAAHQIRGDNGAPSSTMLPAVPFLFSDVLKRNSQEAVSGNHDKHLGQTESPGEASGREDEERLDIEALLVMDVLWTEAGDYSDLTEKALVAARTLTIAVRHEVPMSKKRYVYLLCSFPTEVQEARCELKAF